MKRHGTNPIPLNRAYSALCTTLESKQTLHCRKTVFMKFTWKSFRIVSFINRFGRFSVFPWFRNTTSSSHLQLIPIPIQNLRFNVSPVLNSNGFEWIISSRLRAASICAFSSSYRSSNKSKSLLSAWPIPSLSLRALILSSARQYRLLYDLKRTLKHSNESDSEDDSSLSLSSESSKSPKSSFTFGSGFCKTTGSSFFTFSSSSSTRFWI